MVKTDSIPIDINRNTSAMSVLTPSSKELFTVLHERLEGIAPGERIQILVPKDYSHHGVISPPDTGKFMLLYRNWDALEELQMDIRGSRLHDDVLATLRFDQDNEDGDVIVDIYHLA